MTQKFFWTNQKGQKNADFHADFKKIKKGFEKFTLKKL